METNTLHLEKMNLFVDMYTNEECPVYAVCEGYTRVLMEVRKLYDETITIDVDKLRNDMREECLGAYFGGGFGAALIESFDVDRAEPEQLVEMAQNQGIDLYKYQV